MIPHFPKNDLREVFDSVAPMTVGIEEEVLLLHPETLAPVPVGAEVAARDPRLKLELPAAQLELVTGVHADVRSAVAELAVLRSAMTEACGDLARPACAALHPTATGPMDLTDGPRYLLTDRLHGTVARRQLIGALHVHVAVGGADRTLAVFNALRTFLPELGALAAAAPFYEGDDTGLASARPLVTGLMPRQGIPPAIESWETFAEEQRWGVAAAVLPDRGRWWFELRPHTDHGTLEIRVPDAQPTLAATAAVADACMTLVRALADRHDAGEPLPSAPTWRIAENRWAALRDGLGGTLADLVTAERVPTRERLRELLGDNPLIERNTAIELREVGVDGAASWLADRFSDLD